MPRARKDNASPRYYVTLTEEEAERLEGYAASVDRRPTTAAKELLLAGLAAAAGEAELDFAELQRRCDELQRQCDELQRQLDAVFESEPPPGDATKLPQSSSGPPAGAQWEWPIEELLSEGGWWDRWLPRLYELLGRDLSRERDDGRPGFGAGRRELVVDARGYGDLLSYLFPMAGKVSWRSAEYRAAAAAQDAEGTHEGPPPGVRPHVWEPVLRHVALALCALESTAQPDTDPQLRMEAEARITGSWVQVLNNLVGQQPAAGLPGPIR